MRRSFDTRVRTALGAFWLLDGLLQLQPFMFTRGFAHDVITQAAEGQPPLVAVPVRLAAQAIAAHPIALDAGFALVQLALGTVLLLPRPTRLVRAGLIASVLWSLGVWYLGEGLGGLLSGHAMLLTGAPGAVLLYAALAAAAWPTSDDLVPGRTAQLRTRLVVGSWAAVWTLGAVYQLLPGQRSAAAVSGAIADAADAAPHALTPFLHSVAVDVAAHPAYVVALTAAQALVAILALVPGRPRRASAVIGGSLAAGFWVVGQSLGELLSGQSTDPNAGPLLVLLAVAVGVPAAAVARRVAVPDVDDLVAAHSTRAHAPLRRAA